MGTVASCLQSWRIDTLHAVLVLVAVTHSLSDNGSLAPGIGAAGQPVCGHLNGMQTGIHFTRFYLVTQRLERSHQIFCAGAGLDIVCAKPVDEMWLGDDRLNGHAPVNVGDQRLCHIADDLAAAG